MKKNFCAISIFIKAFVETCKQERWLLMFFGFLLFPLIGHSQLLDAPVNVEALAGLTRPWQIDFSSNVDFNFEDSSLVLDTEKFQEAVFDNGFDYSVSRNFRTPPFVANSEFKTPESIKALVQFWVDIYSKYSTRQGVLHDLDSPELIYEVIDFTDIDGDPHQSAIRRELNRKRRVEIRKKVILQSLAKLARRPRLDKLNLFEKKVWEFYRAKGKLQELKKLAQKSRLRFQLGQSDRMLTAIYYSGRYMEANERIFAEEGLPLELARLPFVESSFNIFAFSKVGASGIWQVMPQSSPQPSGTRRYYDLRNYPPTAARMAAKVLKYGYRLNGSWPLAVIGYNHGPSGVKKQVQKFKTRDIGLLISKHSRAFGFASRNFYPCFLAVLEVERNAKKYFKNVKWSDTLSSIPVKLPLPIKYDELLSWYDNDAKKVQVHNPHLTAQLRKSKGLIPVGTVIEIPKVLADEIQLEMIVKTQKSKISLR